MFRTERANTAIFSPPRLFRAICRLQTTKTTRPAKTSRAPHQENDVSEQPIEIRAPGEILEARRAALLPPFNTEVRSPVLDLPPGTLAEGDPLWAASRAAREYAARSQAKATTNAYKSDWEHFERWCVSRRVPSMPATPYIVALYIAEIAQGGWNGEKAKKAATITRRLAAINAYHKRHSKFLPASQKYPEISLVLQGILRTEGTKQVAKRPITIKMTQKMLDQETVPLAVARDKVILLFGLAGAFRRSELAAVDLNNLRFHPLGMTVTIPFSKTDQTGEGREVEIPFGATPATCPVLSVKNWIAAASLDGKQGPLLRAVDRNGCVGNKRMNPASIAYIIKKLAAAAGYDDKEYSGHSLRSGFVTAAAAGGATDRQIMRQTGHKSQKMIDRYSRRDQQDRQEAAGKVGF
jgi:integrase